jgi:hypothetical protein
MYEATTKYNKPFIGSKFIPYYKVFHFSYRIVFFNIICVSYSTRTSFYKLCGFHKSRSHIKIVYTSSQIWCSGFIVTLFKKLAGTKEALFWKVSVRSTNFYFVMHRFRKFIIIIIITIIKCLDVTHKSALLLNIYNVSKVSPPFCKLSAFTCRIEISEFVFCLMMTLNFATVLPLDALRRLIPPVQILLHLLQNLVCFTMLH